MQEDLIIIQNIDNYDMQIKENSLILKKRIKYLTDVDLLSKDLRNSTLVKSEINTEILNFNKYKHLLLHLYSKIDINIIVKNTVLNISMEELYDKGYKYYENLGMSIQGSDTKRTLKEIINVSKLNKINLTIIIKLKTDEVVYFKT